MTAACYSIECDCVESMGTSSHQIICLKNMKRLGEINWGSGVRESLLHTSSFPEMEIWGLIWLEAHDCLGESGRSY